MNAHTAMSRSAHYSDEMSLDQLRERELELERRRMEFEENHRRLTEERIERETTIPPLEEIQARIERKRHEELASRREVKNERRAQNRSLMMLFLLVAATFTLVWWGMKLMRGG